jgi:hypothetical protein
MSASRLIAIAILLIVVWECRGVQEPNNLLPCQGPVTLTSESGATPTFSWAPRCRATTFIVDPNSDIVDYWVLKTVGDTNGLHPPIAYGATSNGTVTVFGPLSLQAGTSYRARVLRATGDTTRPFEVIGGTFFTP